MRSARVVVILLAFALLTLPLMPVQAFFVASGLPQAARLPHWYHKKLARLFGLKLHITGQFTENRSVLLVANHVSWFDIVALSALTQVSFVAKKEVRSWPFVGWLARLQRTIFVDRERRTSLRETSAEIAQRLNAGDKVLFFPEGTSNDGNRVLPFNSSLFAAVRPSGKQTPSDDQLSQAVVQTVTLAYTRASGLPLGRAQRPLVAWYGDMTLGPHAWGLFRSGPLDISVAIGAPVALDAFEDRKTLARRTRAEISETLAHLLAAYPPDMKEHLASDAAPDMTAQTSPVPSGRDVVATNTNRQT